MRKEQNIWRLPMDGHSLFIFGPDSRLRRVIWELVDHPFFEYTMVRRGCIIERLAIMCHWYCQNRSISSTCTSSTWVSFAMGTAILRGQMGSKGTSVVSCQ